MKRAFLTLVMAALLQAAAVGGFAWLWEAAYGQSRRIGEHLELPLTCAGLVLAGPLAFACATYAIYRFVSYARLRIAVPCVLLLCVPVLLTASLFTHVLGVDRCWW